MVRLVHSYLRQRAFKIKLERQRSRVRTVTAVVRQGSAISPLLISVYTSDIPATAYVNLRMYADNVYIFTRFRDAEIADRRLQTALAGLVCKVENRHPSREKYGFCV
ncbi:hypothetical protein Trydic_g7949 [Trypoxylus dichotomus]